MLISSCPSLHSLTSFFWVREAKEAADPSQSLSSHNAFIRVTDSAGSSHHPPPLGPQVRMPRDGRQPDKRCSAQRAARPIAVTAAECRQTVDIAHATQDTRPQGSLFRKKSSTRWFPRTPVGASGTTASRAIGRDICRSWLFSWPTWVFSNYPRIEDAHLGWGIPPRSEERTVVLRSRHPQGSRMISYNSLITGKSLRKCIHVNHNFLISCIYIVAGNFWGGQGLRHYHKTPSTPSPLLEADTAP